MTNFKIQILRNGNWQDLQSFKHNNEELIQKGVNPFDRLEYWYYNICRERNKLRLIIETIEVVKELP